METDQSFLWFRETTSSDVDPSSCRDGGYKLVPWLSWEEWDFVRDSLFSSSPLSISSALRRITTWRNRGCLPVDIDVTASIVEIQLKDPFFRYDLGDDASLSDAMLTTMHCMAFVRLVNGVVEKTRKKTDVSIGEAADVLNIPRMLIDIRHEGSHRDLPSLQLARIASIKALHWLKSYYWEPQKQMISSQSDRTANLIKEIKSRLYELAFNLKIKRATRSSSSLAKVKRIKHCECLCGCNKFLSFMAAKPQSAKSAGSMRQITKSLKSVVGLYSFHSSEVVSVLLEILLKASDSSELPKDHVECDFDDWKRVIAKLSNKERKFLLTLINGALDMIEPEEYVNYGSVENAISKNALSSASAHQSERLVDLIEWLATHLKGLKPIPDKIFPKATLLPLLRKSLLVSSHRYTPFRNLSLILGHMIGNRPLVEKLDKLCSIRASCLNFREGSCSIVSSDSVLVLPETESIREAIEKFEYVKNLCRMKKREQRVSGSSSNRWVVAKSWNSCPIGMLPRDVGSSGRLPILECGDDDKEVSKPFFQRDGFQGEEQNEVTRERGSDCDVEILKKSNFKKMKKNEEACEINVVEEDDDDPMLEEGVKGCLMINGVWKKVGEEELRAIASNVRILI